jgi:cell division protein FtsB
MAKKKGFVKGCLAIAALVTIFLPGFSRYQELKFQNRSLQTKIAELKAENKRLLEEKRRLETDIVCVEREAREKLGVVRKGEIIYRVVPEEKKQ